MDLLFLLSLVIMKNSNTWKIFSAMIQSMIAEGRIVPSEITVKLLCKAMEESGNDKFLIDGFPRNEENRIVFENVVRIIFHL